MTTGGQPRQQQARGDAAVLLATKLLSPPIRPGLVPRPRLAERLRQGQRGPLTLISAPAGSGKTTAICTWLAASSARSVWLSLDAEDNDPARFWSYVCAACDRLAPGCGAPALGLLRAPQPAPLPVVASTLLNSLALLPPGDAPERAYVLILDDYQFIEAASIHESLALLVERLPPQLHLAITARADPPLPLARLRARGLLTELRANDLRFSLDEASTLIRDVSGLRLSERSIAALASRTEGWAAGLQLAALALHEQSDPEAFVAAFAGSHHYIVDYLAGEVIGQQPAHIRAFLLQTAILEQLCGPLCDALLGIDGAPQAPSRLQHAPAYSQLILAELQRKNLFLVPLDAERRWYRYHQLFADVLRARLYETAPEIVPTLHQRAAAWYAGELARSGPAYLDAAVRHAIAGGDSAAAAGLIEQSAEQLLRHGSFAELIQLLRALPAATVQRSPSLSILLARALFGAAEPDALPPLLDAIAAELPAASLPEAERRSIGAWAVALESQLLRVRGSYAAAIARANEALALLDEGDRHARGFVTMGLALALHMSGQLRAAVAPYQAAIGLLDAADRHNAITTRCLLGLLYRSLGRWADAAATFTQALACAEQHVLGAAVRLPTAGWAMIGLGELAYGRDDLAEAEHQLEAGVALAKQGGVRDALPFGYATLALLRQAQGRPEQARATSAAFLSFAAHDFNLPLVVGWAGAVDARLALVQGDLGRARQWAGGYTPPPGALFLSQAFELVTYLRILVAAGRAAEALALIDERLPAAEDGGDALLAIELLLLRASACGALGQAKAAHAALGRALEMAEPIGAPRLLLDAGAPTVSLPASAGPEPRDAARRAGALAEPLTPRELEILRRVAAGQSNQQIADALVLSVGTVKTHLHHLYGKLDARDRTHAAARARELGLLDES
ncbi:LuxR C-terminal-related transcriptional regulator [Kouleothrix sp.]|uniref:LuxR C-terminal-related transcriptional regulator n=1 Tax=Kouleothrix sp. TaxID=2779161 RepID=UPI00391DE695